MRNKKIAVIIPVFGNQKLTRLLIKDIQREKELVDIYIIDNKGDYSAFGEEIIITARENLGWLKGCNLGMELALKSGYRSLVLLNNDTRLSRNFFRGLLTTYKETGAGLIGPLYDDIFKHQVFKKKCLAYRYKPRKRYKKVRYIDGTCMYIPTDIVRKIGRLDEKTFGNYGWGADIDYSYRVRKKRYDVYVTYLSYLNHKRGSTAKKLYPNYNQLAEKEFLAGLLKKWGEDWRKPQPAEIPQS